jgi:hypothetical protein
MEAGATSEIRTYRLAPEAFEPTVKPRIKRRLAIAAPVMLLAACVGAFLGTSREPDAPNTLPIVIPLFAGIFFFAGYRGWRTQLKREKEGWDSFHLTLSPNVIRRVMANLPPAEILRTEVTQIFQAAGVGLTVKTADRHRFLFVPEQVVGFDEVSRTLATWRAFEPPKPLQNVGAGIAMTAVLLGSWIGCGVIPDIRLAMVSGAILLVTVGFVIREISRLQIADNKTKARMLASMVIFVLAPFARLVLHFVSADQ